MVMLPPLPVALEVSIRKLTRLTLVKAMIDKSRPLKTVGPPRVTAPAVLTMLVPANISWLATMLPV